MNEDRETIWGFRGRWRGLATALLCAALAGCTNLVFQPLRAHVIDPRERGVLLEDRPFAADDQVMLHGWWLPARDGGGPPTPSTARGTVVFLHGNAENISTHIGSVYWLPTAGYNVYLYDYRGFGKSGGVADYAWARRDLLRAIDFVAAQPEAADKPLYVFGQSLGGAIAVSTLAGAPARLKLSALVIEGTPVSLRRVVREALASHWLSWPFQAPLSWLVDDTDSPRDRIADLAPLPLLIVHSRDDRVVPFAHGDELQRRAPPERRWHPTSGRHIAAFGRPAERQVLLDFLAANAGRPAPSPR
jgi:hypothetical protein